MRYVLVAVGGFVLGGALTLGLACLTAWAFDDEGRNRCRPTPIG